MEKGEIARNEQFLFFPQCFLPVWRTFCPFYQTNSCRLQHLSVWKSLKLVVWERVNTFFGTNKVGISKGREKCGKGKRELISISGIFFFSFAKKIIKIQDPVVYG